MQQKLGFRHRKVVVSFDRPAIVSILLALIFGAGPAGRLHLHLYPNDGARKSLKRQRQEDRKQVSHTKRQRRSGECDDAVQRAVAILHGEQRSVESGEAAATTEGAATVAGMLPRPFTSFLGLNELNDLEANAIVPGMSVLSSGFLGLDALAEVEPAAREERSDYNYH